MVPNRNSIDTNNFREIAYRGLSFCLQDPKNLFPCASHIYFILLCFLQMLIQLLQ